MVYRSEATGTYISIDLRLWGQSKDRRIKDAALRSVWEVVKDIAKDMPSPKHDNLNNLIDAMTEGFEDNMEIENNEIDRELGYWHSVLDFHGRGRAYNVYSREIRDDELELLKCTEFVVGEINALIRRINETDDPKRQAKFRKTLRSIMDKYECPEELLINLKEEI